ncbi:hypothetical protein QBC44DRAFT_24636 [Cladorrhinum sp. PSN332]|nr:hypothetical protein QBC44DRAFT_24636 [Cladorrhinum sp. PSN332]
MSILTTVVGIFCFTNRWVFLLSSFVSTAIGFSNFVVMLGNLRLVSCGGYVFHSDLCMFVLDHRGLKKMEKGVYLNWVDVRERDQKSIFVLCHHVWEYLNDSRMSPVPIFTHSFPLHGPQSICIDILQVLCLWLNIAM